MKVGVKISFFFANDSTNNLEILEILFSDLLYSFDFAEISLFQYFSALNDTKGSCISMKPENATGAQVHYQYIHTKNIQQNSAVWPPS